MQTEKQYKTQQMQTNNTFDSEKSKIKQTHKLHYSWRALHLWGPSKQSSSIVDKVPAAYF